MDRIEAKERFMVQMIVNNFLRLLRYLDETGRKEDVKTFLESLAQMDTGYAGHKRQEFKEKEARAGSATQALDAFKKDAGVFFKAEEKGLKVMALVDKALEEEESIAPEAPKEAPKGRFNPNDLN